MDAWLPIIISAKVKVIKLSYEKGTIMVKSNFKLPHTVWDIRSNSYRCLPIFYKDLIDYLKLSGLEYKDNVLDLSLIHI